MNLLCRLWLFPPQAVLIKDTIFTIICNTNNTYWKAIRIAFNFWLNHGYRQLSSTRLNMAFFFNERNLWCLRSLPWRRCRRRFTPLASDAQIEVWTNQKKSFVDRLTSPLKRKEPLLGCLNSTTALEGGYGWIAAYSWLNRLQGKLSV